jgi:hypothetical protein
METPPTKRGYIHLNAVRLLPSDTPCAVICQALCCSDRMVRLWIELFNHGGVGAMSNRLSGGRKRKVKLERVCNLLVPVLEKPAQAGVVHWTGITPHGYLKEQLCVDLGCRTAVRWLHELSYQLGVSRPWPER